MSECTNQIRFFKVTELPVTGVPNAIYLLLDGGFVRQYVTDSNGVIFSAPSVVETLTSLRKATNSIIYTDEAGGETTINFAPVAFTGSYNDLVGSPTNTSSFTNDGDGTSPYATLDDIPTDLGDLTFDFDIGSSIRFSPGDPTTLELVDRNGVVISNVSITPVNIAGLSSYTGFDVRYYTIGQLNDFFAGNTPITGYNKAQWDEAYSWGDHSLAGYLTSFTETDPIFNASPAAGITNTNISQWNIAYSWGDHRNVGYLTEFIETDPLFQLSAAAGIDSLDIARWDEAHSWGDHATAGYLTSFTETDPVFLASPAAGITPTQISNWDAAHSWGDHALAGYLTDAPSDGNQYARQDAGWAVVDLSAAGDNLGDHTATQDLNLASFNIVNTVNNHVVVPTLNNGWDFQVPSQSTGTEVGGRNLKVYRSQGYAQINIGNPQVAQDIALYFSDRGLIHSGGINPLVLRNENNAGVEVQDDLVVTGDITTDGDLFVETGSIILRRPGTESLAIGVQAGALETGIAGTANIFIGGAAGSNVTTGVRNTIIGQGAGSFIDTEQENTIIGRNANTSGDFRRGTAIGAGARAGGGGVSIGYSTGSNLNSSAVTFGQNTVAIGSQAAQTYDDRAGGTGNLTGASQGTYIGRATKAGKNDAVNETVIGHGQTGFGDLTTTIGCNQNEETYLMHRGVNGLFYYDDDTDTAHIVYHEGNLDLAALNGVTADGTETTKEVPYWGDAGNKVLTSQSTFRYDTDIDGGVLFTQALRSNFTRNYMGGLIILDSVPTGVTTPTTPGGTGLNVIKNGVGIAYASSASPGTALFRVGEVGSPGSGYMEIRRNTGGEATVHNLESDPLYTSWLFDSDGIGSIKYSFGLFTNTPDTLYRLTVAGDSLFTAITDFDNETTVLTGNDFNVDGGDINHTGKINTAVGAGAFINNTAVGRVALQNLVEGDGRQNTAVGYFAGRLTSTGRANTYLGYVAGQNVTTGEENIYIGSSASGANAFGNTIISSTPFIANIGSNNTGLGRRVVMNAASSYQVVIGGYAESEGSGRTVIGNQKRSNFTYNQATYLGGTLVLRSVWGEGDLQAQNDSKIDFYDEWNDVGGTPKLTFQIGSIADLDQRYTFVFRNNVTNQSVRLNENGTTNGLKFFDGTTEQTVYHEGNLTPLEATDIDTLAELNAVVTDATLITDAPADGNTYGRNNNAWVQTSGGSATLVGLTDTNISAPADGEVLTYDGAEWVNEASAADKTFTFTQAVPAATWNINHNLGKFPSVTIIDSSNQQVIGDVEYIDNNNVTVTFSAGFSGRAELN